MRRVPKLEIALWVVVAVLLACAVARGQQPTAVITGPKEAPVGDLVILDASQSQGLGFLWLLVNSEKSFLPVDGGIRCVFASGSPGRFLFVLVTSGTNNNGGPAAATAKHELNITGGTPPTPTPTPTPTPKPDPTVPPTNARSAVILVETSDLSPDQANLLNQLRNQPISSKVRILDKDATTTEGQPLPAAQAALKFASGKPLPLLLSVKEDGGFSAVVELPASLEAITKQLESWGVKP